MKKILFLLLISIGGFTVNCQVPAINPINWIQSGPMVGACDAHEVVLWVQTIESCSIKVRYWVKGNSQADFFTETVVTRAEKAFTTKLIANKVLPGFTYNYELIINNLPVSFDYLLQFKTPPTFLSQTESFTVAIGSCLYINDDEVDQSAKPYGGNYEILESIHGKHPDMMLWLGDNTYLRKSDWNSLTGIQKRYTHSRSIPEMQALLASSQHYAIWDDHDYGPNDGNKSWIHKDLSLQVFKDFWGNPSYGFDGIPCAVTQFNWADVDFFLLDDRWFRDANGLTGVKSYFGEQQLDWLINALKMSTAKFKVIANGGQIINPAMVFENYANYPEEREKLLNRLHDEKIEGVIFLSGDRHSSELSKMERKDAYPLYDLTISPLTSGAANPTKEANTLRVEGSLVVERNFAILEFKGASKERSLVITVFNSRGQKIWDRLIDYNSLVY